jgi:thioredoxin reductase
MEMNIEHVLYFAPMLLIWGGYVQRRAKAQRQSVAVREQARKAGLSQPASLHPKIDRNRCIGCGSCVTACPEQPSHHVLGLIDGKAQLVSPADCIGHGACKSVCPMDVITLVFGTKERGVDIPEVSPGFETNVPGIFIAGELGGMGLIRNAIEQGRQAIESIRRLDGIGEGERLDVVIVGAGPAGFSASLNALKHKLRYVTVEQESLGGTVFQFPRGKLVMTAPVDLPLVGKLRITETTKESLLGFWRGVEQKTGVRIQYHESVTEINSGDHGLMVKTSKGSYRTRAVLLAIGRRGTPRKLGVPGEDTPKVTYRLMDPEQYRGHHVLVVGGGDSALEAATSIAAEPGTSVTLSYRSDAFARAKEKNRRKVREAEKEGRLKVLMRSQVKEITDARVKIDVHGELVDLANDAIIVNAGGILPNGFLKGIGIHVETKYGTA